MPLLDTILFSTHLGDLELLGFTTEQGRKSIARVTMDAVLYPGENTLEGLVPLQ